jgi:hypothetical protein
MAPILFRFLCWLILSHVVYPSTHLSPRAANLGIQFIAFDATLDNGDVVQYAFYGGIVKYEKDIRELFPSDTVRHIAGLGKKALEEATDLEEFVSSNGRSHRLTGMDTFVVGK